MMFWFTILNVNHFDAQTAVSTNNLHSGGLIGDWIG